MTLVFPVYEFNHGTIKSRGLQEGAAVPVEFVTLNTPGYTYLHYSARPVYIVPAGSRTRLDIEPIKVYRVNQPPILGGAATPVLEE